jgi:uracil-DNA glycosylase
MNINIEKTWFEVLEAEFQKDYYIELMKFVNLEYQNKVCYPPLDLVFSAFEKCSFSNLKVVIVGQDPYHGAGQANGLAFSVKENIGLPPSLRNIFKELQLDIGIPIPKSGDLSFWAKQGVLLLNTTLTVAESKAGSHQKKGWEDFTDSIIQTINNKKENIVFLLWGAFAQNKCKKINESKHFILKAKHPSPLSANFGGWFGQKHFSQANSYLESKGITKIDW